LTRFKDDEWSGPAWYKIKTDSDGYPEEWKIVHFHPLNLGTHTATEFEAKDVAGILEDTYKNNKNLLKNTYMGLIHSHNTMGSFFSGTDKDTLLDMAPVENFYGSTIVASSGKELVSFGFSYKDQYGVSHTHIIDEDEIELENTYKVNNDWVKLGDVIEKTKPKPVVTYTGRVYGGYGGNNQTALFGIPNKRSKKAEKKIKAILKKFEEGTLDDGKCEQQLMALGVKADEATRLMYMQDAYSYGGYHGYY
jgi:hypothetical protein